MKRMSWTATGLVAALVVSPGLALAQAPAGEHADHRPATDAAPADKIGELLTKMNAAKGDAKTAAMAELLTALVEKHQGCEKKMSAMGDMKKMVDPDKK